MYRITHIPLGFKPLKKTFNCVRHHGRGGSDVIIRNITLNLLRERVLRVRGSVVLA